MVTLLYNRPLRCESLYLVQSAVGYWVDKYLHPIYTLSSQYLQTIYTLSTHYLHTIYTLSIHYLHTIYSLSIWCSQQWCTGCRLRHLSPRRIHRWRTIWKHTGPHYPQLHPVTSNLPLGVYQVPQVAVVGAEVEESIPGIYDGVRE